MGEAWPYEQGGVGVGRDKGRRAGPAGAGGAAADAVQEDVVAKRARGMGPKGRVASAARKGTKAGGGGGDSWGGERGEGGGRRGRRGHDIVTTGQCCSVAATVALMKTGVKSIQPANNRIDQKEVGAPKLVTEFHL
eukprot:366458-Chlamydomonas_euryale.AAC.5